MKGYIILDIEVTDPDDYARYREVAAPTVAAYGGRYLVRGGQPETLEGQWKPSRIVVLEFESVERAREWYSSSEYSAVKPMRLSTTISEAILVTGL